MKGLLQDLLQLLWHWSWENSMMALEIFHNVLGQLNKTEASSTAVMMVHNLLHLFDAVRMMWEPEPHRDTLGNDSCPAAQPWEQLLGWIPGPAAQNCFCPLWAGIPQHRVSHLSSAPPAGREPLYAKLSFPSSYQKEECVRQLSICLFRDLLDKTVWRDKKVMKRNAWKALVRLILCMSDQVPGVAKVLMSRLSTDPERGG